MIMFRAMAHSWFRFVFICVVCQKTNVGAIGNIYGVGYFNFDFEQTFPGKCLSIPPTAESNVTTADCDLPGKFDNTFSINESMARTNYILNLFGSNMTALVINNGFIGDIPEEVCGMKSLKQLGLQNNNLTTINPPTCFTGMNRLQSLYLSFNRISYLSKDIFKDLFSLTHLDLSANEISISFLDFIPVGVLTNLSFLSLRSNKLKCVSWNYSYPCFVPVPGYLYLGADGFRALNAPAEPSSYSGSAYFELDLSNNKISVLSFGYLQTFPQLQKLDVSNNYFEYIQTGIFNQTRLLLELNLSFNSLWALGTNIFAQLQLLQNLYLNNNRIYSLDKDLFKSNLALTTLDLSSNQIFALPVGIFTSLRSLRYLYLSNNLISEIADYVLRNNLPLEVLDLSHNSISDLSRIKLNQIIPRIQTLDLSNNFMKVINFKSQLSFGWTWFQNLRKLDLSKNQLASLDIWPLFIGQFCHECLVDLRDNNITAFTNSFYDDIDPIFSDVVTPFGMTLNLAGNDVSHISDMMDKWHFNKESTIFNAIENHFRNSFKLIMNSLKCDCIDSQAIDLIQKKTYNLDASLVTCSKSSNVKDKTVYKVPIDALVCKVEDQCPAPCVCIDQPSTRTMIINCTNAGFTDLPATLPSLNLYSGYNYQLIFTKSSFSRLNYKEYLKNTKYIDISSSSIEEIDSRTWKAFQNMSDIRLNANKLKTFDRIQLYGLQAKLDIQNNPITCDCENQWLKSWLESMGDKIINPNGILCNEPYWLENKPVILLRTEEFCSSRPFTQTEVLEMTIIPSVGGLVLMILVSFALLQRFRVKMYKYVKIHPFDRDECEGEDMEWDVFLASSSEDEEISKTLITLLKNEGCRVCFHEDDFIPGEKIIDNIINAIEKSKRVLCLLTRNFTKSHYCMEEFRLSLLRNFQKKRRRTVLILNEPIQNFQGDDVAVEVRDYLAMYTCIEMGKADWEDQLIYKMPINRVLNDEAPKNEPVHPAIKQLRENEMDIRAVHGSLFLDPTRPDPTRRNVDPTRPAIADK